MKKTISILIILATAINIQIANADYTFGTPTNIGWGTSPSVPTDGLSLYIDFYERPGGYGNYDIWFYARETIHDDWSGPFNLGPPINNWAGQGNPDIWGDGLTLIWDDDRPGTRGYSDMWVSTRETTDPNEEWSEPVNLAINSDYDDSHSSVSSDSLSLFFCSDRGGYGDGDRDIYVSTRATINDPWSEPENLGSIINSPTRDSGPDISGDGLTLFFNSERPGGYGRRDIWVTRRATTEAPWGEPVNLGPIVNTSYQDMQPCISADGSILYFCSNRSGAHEIWQVPIIPIVDFNGDKVVNSADMCMVVDNWGTNTSLCDIGPTPLGDGKVDFRDLAVLAEYWLVDNRLIAHWKLDENEGFIAHDSVGDKNGTVAGAIWQPIGGQLGGALEFDGEFDLVSTDFVLNPMEGAFSAFAWIKGGAPGQVIISQT
ncbi:MAG: hypothetical protein ACYTFW_24755, partial [Planctomycetota bacterium]